MSLIIVNEDSLDVSRACVYSHLWTLFFFLTPFYTVWGGGLCVQQVGGLGGVTVGTKVWSTHRLVGVAHCVLTGAGN